MKVKVIVDIPETHLCINRGDICPFLDYLRLHTHNICSCKIFQVELESTGEVRKCAACLSIKEYADVDKD